MRLLQAHLPESRRGTGRDHLDPLAQYVPLLNVAALPLWWIILLLIPCVGIFVFWYIWFKISERLGHGTGFFIGIVLLPIIFIPLLAFGQSPNQVEQAQ